MRIRNLYEDDAGVSHFRDIEVRGKSYANRTRLAREPASFIIFRETTQDYTVDWHPAPRRQYVINWTARCISPPETARPVT